MRDPARIPQMLAVLEVAWEDNPDLRLGQLLGNLDVGYFTEDDETLTRLEGLAMRGLKGLLAKINDEEDSC